MSINKVRAKKAKGNLHSLGSHLPPVPATNPIRPTRVTKAVTQANMPPASNLVSKVKLPSGSVHEQGAAPRDDAKRYRDLGYADQTHSQAHSVTPNKKKISSPKTSRLFRRNN